MHRVSLSHVFFPRHQVCTKWCSFVFMLPQLRHSGKSSFLFHLPAHSSTVMIFMPWPTDGLISTGSPEHVHDASVGSFGTRHSHGTFLLRLVHPRTVHDFPPFDAVHLCTWLGIQVRLDVCSEVQVVGQLGFGHLDAMRCTKTRTCDVPNATRTVAMADANRRTTSLSSPIPAEDAFTYPLASTGQGRKGRKWTRKRYVPSSPALRCGLTWRLISEGKVVWRSHGDRTGAWNHRNMCATASVPSEKKWQDHVEWC